MASARYGKRLVAGAEASHMQTSDAFRGLACTECGELFEWDAERCLDCDAPLDPEYDLDAVDPGALRTAVDSAWGYDAVLPFSADVAVTADEGGTPLVDAPSLAGELGVERLLLKDEGRNPTGTVLDRGLSLAVTAAAETGAELLALASPGNSGQSMAAYAGRVGLRSYSFVPSRAPFSNKALTNVHGGEMKVVPGRFDDAREALADQLQSEYRSLQEFTTPYRHEGVKTLAYELLADLDWTSPDAVVVPASTGEVVVGVTKGFRECRDLGLVEDLPTVYAVQPSGCAPIVAAWERGVAAVEPWESPDTIVGELEITAPAGGELALAALDATGGDAVTVDDSDALESAVTVARHETIEAGLAGGVAAAGAWELADAFDEDATVVLLNTEAGAKTPDILRSHLMGQGL